MGIKQLARQNQNNQKWPFKIVFEIYCILKNYHVRMSMYEKKILFPKVVNDSNIRLKLDSELPLTK